jgi:beta-lactam-binding protein with PASTA domain
MADQPDRSQGQPQGQQPAVLAGSRVVLLVSKGPSPVPSPTYLAVPDVSSKSQGDALESLQAVGMTARVFDEPSETVPHGHVMAQTPRAGQSAMADAEIVLLVSSGKPAQQTGYVVLPIVAGAAETDAVAKIQAAGLSAQTVHDFSPTVPSGIVIDQVPNAASVSAPVKKSLLWLWILIAVLVVAVIAGGAYMYLNRTTAVPDVVGKPQAEAQALIVAAGFKVGAVDTTQTAEASEVGNVVAEQPLPGTQQKVGSNVNIVVSGGQALIAVPNVVGMTQAAAETALTQAGLTAAAQSGNSATVAKGEVISQSPPAAQRVPAGTSIGITVSQGPANAAVPNVVGQTQSDATASLKSAGLGTKVVTNYNVDTPKGEVYSQSPVEGTLVAPGTTVQIVVSNGPPPAPATVDVPNVIGKTQSDATTTLQNLGFKVAVSEIATGTAGKVVYQAPKSGTSEPKGSTVSITVSITP